MGPGAAAAAGAPRKTWIDSVVPFRVQVPNTPEVWVKPKDARVSPLNVALLTIGAPEEEDKLKKNY